MKTQKLFFKFLAVFFAISFLFSCRNETEAVNNSNSETNSHDEISFKTFKKDTKINDLGEFFDQNSINQKNNSSENPLNGFIIDTTKIYRINANNELSTFALRIYSLHDSPDVLYNLVYRKRNDGSVHYSILKIESAKVSLVYDSEKKPSLKEVKNNTTSKTACTEFIAEFFHCKNGKDWEHCDHCSDCVTTVNITYGDCGGGESSGGGWIPPSNPPSGSNNNSYEAGASTVYYTDPSGYVFDPNMQPTIDPNYLRASYAYYFWTQLDSVSYLAKQWAAENPDIYQNLIENYLNNYSTTDNTPNLQFHNWAIQFLMQNSTNGISDVSWTQFQEWFVEGNNLSSTEMQDFLNDWNNPNIVKPTLRFKNNTRLNCIFNKAKTSANFKQYLTNYDSRFSVAHLQFDVKSLPSSTNAQTNYPIGYWIKIDINSNNLNRPTLDIARTLMHEIIHAEMFRILLSIAPTSNGQIDVVQLKAMLNARDYPGIYDYYRRYGVNNMQHEQMAAHFRGIIKNFLKQIDGSITDVQAESMAWVGLQGTVAWNNLGSTNQNNILNTYNNWYNSATHSCP